ncbi:1-phosphofructokinase [Paraoerskovia sediminicola]|uniref:1-phosphofructokinase n=1 Tax=Paraoerskovia sediminicola TaxID=1138587 RepID=A0ABN6XBA9_9CELL|nr:1-phosphofructokinase [Paraoerskovia sediminicola]BDZ41990.1 1-phosphofructokinase [Paraoerskovia sediminicola]
MIVTLTPNPSVDRAVVVDRLRRGEVHRASSTHVDPGGKGVNVSRALAARGSATVAVLPVGGPEGRLLVQLLDEAGVASRGVPIAGSVRTNISVLDVDGTTTKINEAGPRLLPDDVATLLDATLAEFAGTGWIVGCGSLPPGAPVGLYASLVEAGRAVGARVAVDSSGPSMAAALAARPHLVKPNHEELEELAGRELATLGDVRDEALRLVDAGIETVAVSLGGDGALLVDAETTVHARAHVSAPVSTVGAGDCMLAGLLDALAAGLDQSAALAAAVRSGSAAVALPGSSVPTPQDLADVAVDVDTSPTLGRRLGR